MTVYKYVGRTKKGVLKKGTIDSLNEKLAISMLREQGINPREISESTSILHKDITVGSPVKQQDFVIYCRQFATLIRAGIPVVEATGILASQTESKGLKKALIRVKEEIKDGNSFSDTVAKQPAIFPAIFSNMIRAGEATGSLDETLDRLAGYFEKQYALKKKIQSTLAYPLVLLAITAIVVVFMMTTIVPQFTSMFEQFGADLPGITLFVLALSELVQGYWWALLLGLILIVVIVKVSLSKSATFHFGFSTALLKIPIFGKLLQKALIARMARTLSSLFTSSVPILQALLIVERVVDHPVMGKTLREARTSLQSGNSLAEPFEKSWLFPPLVSQMTSIGEKTGSLDFMLANIADFYEAEVERTVDTLKSLIEPLMIVFLAVIVGVIVLAIMVPMFSLFEQI